MEPVLLVSAYVRQFQLIINSIYLQPFNNFYTINVMALFSKSQKKIPELPPKFPSLGKISSDQTTQISSSPQDFNESFFQIPQQSQFQVFISKSKKLIDQGFTKLGRLGLGTSNGDKMVRMCTSTIKVLKAYGIVKNSDVIKGINNLNTQLGQTRKVFRFNSKWSTIKQLIQLSKKQNKNKMDNFNILFKLFQLSSDLIDEFIYMLQIKILSSPHQDTLDQTSSNFYFLQCFISLFLHSYQLVNIRKNIKSSTSKSDQSFNQHNRKLLTVIKYILDVLTSHNQFTYKLFNASPKLIAFAGTLSSIIGLKLAWK